MAFHKSIHDAWDKDHETGIHNASLKMRERGKKNFECLKLKITKSCCKTMTKSCALWMNLYMIRWHVFCK